MTTPARLRQCVQYAPASDGVRLAWAESGSGPVVVKAANWLTHLELPDASFDAVTCACGLIVFPDAHRALAEMRRVLRPGGRIAIGVWDEPSKSPFVTVGGGGALSQFHAATPPNPKSPGAFRFSKRDVLEGVLRDAGFSDIRIDSVTMPIEFGSTEEYWQMFTECAAGVKPKIAMLSREDQMRLRRLVDDLAAPFMTAGRLRLAGTPLCAAARV